VPVAVSDSDISITTGLLATGALLVAGLALFVAHRAGRGAPAVKAAQRRAEPVDTATTVALLVELGEAMIDSGYSVSQVQVTLRAVLDVHGFPDGEVIVLPTALFVSVPGAAAVETAVSAAGLSSLRLDQVDAVSRVVSAAETGAIRPADARSALVDARTSTPPFGPGLRTLGYALLSTGVTLVLRGSAIDVLVAAALGAVVGAAKIVAGRAGTATRAVLPVLCAFFVATSVFLLARLGVDLGVLAPLAAPLVTFLPGALLTIAVIELSTGQMISGAGRLAAGLLQLALLALGILAGAKLVGVSSTSMSTGARPLGDLGPWIGVALFGVGVLVHHCARRSSFGWILLVLYVAYGAQIIGGFVLGAVLSAFVGALVMSPVAAYVAHRPSGPPMQVSFLPAFWLLVPGALGLAGVTALLNDRGAAGLTDLVSMGTTMIGISFGVLIGVAVGEALVRRLESRTAADGLLEVPHLLTVDRERPDDQDVEADHHGGPDGVGGKERDVEDGAQSR
jgi:uncharacterized membrane protein YjjP (DUF1212 family)